MSDTPKSNEYPPLSSSSSNPSGTQAPHITVEDAKPDDTVAPVEVAVSSEPDVPVQETPELPVEADLPQVVVTPQADAFDTQNVKEEFKAPLPSATEEPEAPEAVEKLRQAVRETMKDNEAQSEQAIAMFEQMSQGFKSAMEDARNDVARVGFKLMEFAQANLRNNVELARDYAAVQTVPEAFNVQATYVKRQIELMSQQAEELRALTAEIASKKAAQFQGRIESR